MVAGKQSRLVLVTCGSRKEAQKIATSAVAKKLAACVNILPSRIESIYRWKGKVESAREVLLLIKTTANRLAELEREVKRLHSYDVPEFIALSVAGGSRDYFGWLAENVQK